jgi:hypothetical protein
MIADAIKSFFPEFYWGGASTMPRLCSITMIQDEPILLTVEDRMETGERAKFGIEIYREHHVLVPSLKYLGAVSRAGGSAASSDSWLPFIGNCLEECTTRHKGCRAMTAEKPPSRILDLEVLRTGSGDHQADVRLIRTSPNRDP